MQNRCYSKLFVTFEQANAINWYEELSVSAVSKPITIGVFQVLVVLVVVKIL